MPKSSGIVVSSIILASVLCSLLIFPLAFDSGVDPAQGPQLAFIVLPAIFIGMPGGDIVGTLFFVLLAFAALSSSIAGLDPAGGWLMERFGLKRASAVAIVAAAAWMLGLATVLSFNHWSDVHPLAGIERFKSATLFDLTDFFASNMLLPVGALLTSLLVGWRLDRAVSAGDFGANPRVRAVLLMLLKYLCPLAIVGVLASAL